MLDLRKQQVLELKKAKGLEGRKAEIVFALDYSGSMSGLYNNGTVQSVISRLFPVALAFDDDGEMPMYLFSNGYTKLDPVNLGNYANYKSQVIDRCGEGMNGTEYSPVLRKILSDFGGSSGFLGFGKKEAKDPIYVIFITDGDTYDRYETESVIREMSKKNIFVQFIGIGREELNFLQKLDDLDGRDVDNTDFKKIESIAQITDENLYALLMDEFPGWIQIAKQKGLIN